MRQDNTTKIDELMEEIISTGAENMGAVFGELFNIAMRIERERFLEAEPYARSDTRRGYANGFKPKRLDTQAGTITVSVPKTRDHDEPFYPQALERGQRSSRAILLAIAEMYIHGVSTRDVEGVMSQFGIANVSSTQVSRACQMLDQELEAWRTRPLGLFKYLILDARYEKVRRDGVVRDVAVLSAIGIDAQGRRHLLGVSIAISEAEIHWRTFLESLIKRGLYGVEFVVSDDHSGLKAARRAVLGGALWQRCQYHLAANAIQNAPNLAIRKLLAPLNN